MAFPLLVWDFSSRMIARALQIRETLVEGTPLNRDGGGQGDREDWP
jgi:hypothetical protein